MTQYNLKSIRQEFRRNGVFYTPKEQAEYIKSFLPTEVTEVYDPTCGDGGLLSVFDDQVKKYGQELNQEQLKIAQERLINFDGIAGDTLVNPAFMNKKFDAIVANYPFSIRWNPPQQDMFNSDPRFLGLPVLPPPAKADYAFILHCLYLLSETGTAVIMGSPGILYRTQREQKIRQWLIENNYIEKIVSIPGKKFVDTTIATCLLILRKNKNTSDVIFIDSENKLERTVSIEEIKSKDYNLSVNMYISIEPPKKAIDPIDPIDPIELETTAQELFIKQLRAQLKFTKAVSFLDKVDLQSFIKKLQAVLDEYKEN